MLNIFRKRGRRFEQARKKKVLVRPRGETRGEDANHFNGPAVEPNGLGNHRLAAEACRPELMREHAHGRAIGTIVCGGKNPALRRGYPQGREKIARDAQHIQLFRGAISRREIG